MTVFNGTNGNDILKGSTADDTLSGMQANDQLYGAGGSDNYVYRRGDGIDTIFNSGSGNDVDSNGSLDVLQFSDVKSSEVEFMRQENQLIVSLLDGTGSVTINDYYAADVLNKVEKISFYDGLSYNNVLDSTATMNGTDGNDLYIKNAGSGTIVEQASAGIDTVQSAIDYTLENANLENLVLLAGALAGTGNALANTIIGNAGNNVLDGGAGSDRLSGGAGDDIYYVDNVSDKVIELSRQGTDIVYSSVSFTFGAQYIENLTLTGDANINAKGNSLDNIIIGNSGNNVLDGGEGTDQLFGGLGDDTYYVDSWSLDPSYGNQITELSGEGYDQVIAERSFGLRDGVEIEKISLTATTTGNWFPTAYGNSSDNLIVAAPIGSWLYGKAGNDVLEGKAGGDRLDGGVGDDVLKGGNGNDHYDVDSVGDQVIELSRQGTDEVYSSISFKLGAQHIERLTLTGSSNINGTGNSLDNRIIGNTGNNVLNGGAGDDELVGGLGDDTYYVDKTSGGFLLGDRVIEFSGEGYDQVFSRVAYVLAADAEIEKLTLVGLEANVGSGNGFNNTIVAAALVDTTLNGFAGSDVLRGNTGNDVLNGGVGADTLSGGSGDDIYFLDDAGDTVVELNRPGIDLVYSQVSLVLGKQYIENVILQGSDDTSVIGNSLNNNIRGSDGNNTLKGANGDDVLDGGAGSDILFGGNGNDSLSGGSGDDVLKGAFGDDTYYVDSADDQVTEYNGQGADTVYSSLSYALGANYIENLTLMGSASINASGNSLQNHLTGNNADNILRGGNGSDVLAGQLGNDILSGGNGDDKLIGGAGNDRLIGGAETDTAVYDVINASHATGGNGLDSWSDFGVSNFGDSVNADKIDISALLIDYAGDGSMAALNPYISTSISHGSTTLSIDRDGAGSTFNSTALLILSGVQVDIAVLLKNQQIIV